MIQSSDYRTNCWTHARSHFSKEKLPHIMYLFVEYCETLQMGCRVVKLHHQLCLIPHIIFGTIRVSLNEESRRHAPDPRAAAVVEEVAESMMAGMTALCVTEFPDPLLSSASLASPVTGPAWRVATLTQCGERAVNCERGCLNTG